MRFIFSFLIVNFFIFSGFSQTILSGNNRPYKDGEKIKYELYYGPITGGYTTGTIKSERIENKEVFHAIMIAQSSGLADILYSIKDIYESYFDAVNGLPYSSIRNVQEGSYKQLINVQFDHIKNQLVSSKSGFHKVPSSTHDILSAFYALRSMNYNSLKEGEIIIFQTYFGDEMFQLKIRYRGKDVVKTGLGKISCYRFAPVTEVGRAFASEDDMTIWISDDENHVPIRVKMNLRVGSIKCDLIEYSNLVSELKKLP
jgi:hypothetical protein